MTDNNDIPTDGWSSVTTREADVVRRRGPRKRVLCLTVAYHTDLGRIGHRAVVGSLGSAGEVPLSRLSPAFGPPGGLPSRSRPIGDPFVSRRPVVLVGAPGRGVSLRRSPDAMPVSIDGRAVADERLIDSEAIDRGAVIELARRVVLVLHRADPSPQPGPDLGLIGQSDSLARLRAEVLMVASHDVPVLICGETGSGKELVAHAIHESSARHDSPWVPVNVAAIPTTTAVSQLFGHVRGAFTGATGDHPGYFGRAHRGTLFLDEVGDLPTDLQPTLLRALESGEIQPVGARSPKRVDARIVSATDADLGQAVQDGRFRLPLLQRLSGFRLEVPPLRARREDIGLLLAHFLRSELVERGDAALLATPVSEPDPWLPAPLIARLVAHDWPGNVRQLRNVARWISVCGSGMPHVLFEPGDALEVLLEEPNRGGARGDAAPGAAEASPPIRPQDMDEAGVVAALRANQWQPGAAAKQLGISRTTMYALMDQFPRIRKAGELGAADIEAAAAASGGNVKAMAEQLEVSRPGLRRRMKELGLGRS